jgi:hypothetical protein
MAGNISNRRSIAINGKCLCLDDAAHDLKPKHPIFPNPLKMDLASVDRPTPTDYYLYPGTQSLVGSVSVLPMQTNKFPEIDSGVVSSLENFVETADAEANSGGLNGKGPTSVALARHASYCLWGFSGSP